MSTYLGNFDQDLRRLGIVPPRHETHAPYIPDGRARCPRCAVVLNDERRPADFTDHMSGINLCPDCQSNEAERLASTR